MKNYAIIVTGDSYYSNRIKRESCVILNDGMHDFVGLIGMYKSQFVGNISFVKKELAKMANENECELSFDKKQFEDNSIYYKIVSRAEINRLYGFDILKNQLK